MATNIVGIMRHRARIASGANKSEVVYLDGRAPVSVEIPSNWTGAASHISFDASFDGGATYKTLYDKTGAEYAIANIVPGMILNIPAVDLDGVTHLKLCSGLHGALVTQTTDLKDCYIGSRQV